MVIHRIKIAFVLVLLILVLLLVAACLGPGDPGSSGRGIPSGEVAATAEPANGPQGATSDGSSGEEMPPRLVQRQDNDIRFERFSLDEGLSQSVVPCIFQDDRGYMWFGTQDGLNRYDGYEFVVYKHDPEDPDSLSASFIWSLYQDRSGTFWVGTNGGGLDRYDPETGSFSHYKHDSEDPHSLSSDVVMFIYEDREGVLWLGTNGGGLNRFDAETGQFSHYTYDGNDDSSLSHNTVQEIFEDREGVLWVGTAGGGLNRFDRETGQFTRYRNDPQDPNSLSHNNVQAIYEDRQGTLWIGTNGGGLDRFDRETGEFVHFQSDPSDVHSLSSNQVWSIHEDQVGVLWIGTNGGGLDRLEERAAIGGGEPRFVHYRNDPEDDLSLSNDQVWSVYEDRTGGLWVGTFGGGFNYFDRQGEKFAHYRAVPGDPNSLSANVVWSLLEDREGVLWIGTNGEGLNRLDRETNSYLHYRHVETDTHSLSHDVVWSLYQDREGAIWVGTSAGLDRFDGETGQFSHYESLPVFKILEDGEGTLWFGTWGGGLGRLDAGAEKPTFYQNDPADDHSLGNNSVVALFEDREGTLWVGTFNGGLNRFDRSTERFTRYQSDPDDGQSLSHNTVLAIHQDGDGVLWVATGGGGLNRFDSATETFTCYREQHGLPNDMVYGILEDQPADGDGAGRLWLSTNLGLSRFDPRTEAFRNYDVADGLQSNEFNQGAYHKGPSGEMYFGGVNGFNAFFPEQVRDNPYVPPIVLTALTQGGEALDTGTAADSTTAVTFNWPGNYFEFEFAALGFSQPEKNQYAYMLEGFDEGWIETGTRRFGQYTNLPGGTYTLRLKGSNNDGLWNEEGVALTITVVPPFWATWWFRGIAIGLLVGGVIAGYRLRVRSVESRSRQLAVQVASRTKELAALNAVAAVVSRSLDLHEILRDALDMTLKVMEMEGGGIYLLDDKAEKLSLIAHRGHSKEFVDEIDGLEVGEGFSGRVVQSGLPLVVSDVSADERLTRLIAREEGFHSLASVPLSSKGRVLGTLYVMTRAYRDFSDQDVELLMSIGHQIGVALENAHLYQDASTRLAQLTALQETTKAVASTLELDRLLNLIIEQATTLLQAGGGLINLVDWGSQEDEVVAASGSAIPLLGRRVPLEGSLSGWVALHNEPVIANELQTDSRVYEPSLSWTGAGQLESAALAPLTIKEQVVGTLVVMGEEEGKQEFTQPDLDLLVAFANQAATAIDNAQLFEAEQRRAEQFRLISEVGHKIITILDAGQLLDEIVRQVNEILGHYMVGIGLIKGDRVYVKTGVGPYWESPGAEPFHLEVGERGIVGWVAAHGEPLLVPDVSQDPRYIRVMEEAETRSELAVPMRSQDRVIGVLDVQSRKLDAFDESDVEVLQALANQAAVAIEKAWLLQAERKRADELDALRTTMADITSELELATLLQAIVERAAGLLEASGGEFGLYDETSQELRIVVSYNLGHDYVGARHRLGEGAMGRVAETGESMIIDDYSAWQGSLAEYGHIHATLAAPLKVGGRLIGVFTTVSTDPDRRFTPADMHLLDLFAQQAAIAIENARLYEQAQQLAVVEERQRLARDLHDSVTQALYGVTLYSEAAAGQLTLGRADRAAEHLRELQDSAREALTEMRLLIYELRPPVLEEEGLIAALRARLTAVEGRIGLKTELKVEGEFDLQPETEEELYRIAQEALNNALKHAEPHHIWISLRQEEGTVILEIADDGLGFDLATARDRGGFGLPAMEQRVAGLGGRLSITSKPQEGTRVRVEVSL